MVFSKRRIKEQLKEQLELEIYSNEMGDPAKSSLRGLVDLQLLSEKNVFLVFL